MAAGLLRVRRAEFDGAVQLAMTRYGWDRARAVRAAESLYVVVDRERGGLR